MTPITERLAEPEDEVTQALRMWYCDGAPGRVFCQRDKDSMRAIIERARTHPAEGGEGRDYVLVPREPTHEMLSSAGMMANYDPHAAGASPDHDHVEWWRSMIEAAPPPQPVAPEDETINAKLLWPLLGNGNFYLDPPDGGDVPLIEQLRRMSEDAAKWRASERGESKAVAYMPTKSLEWMLNGDMDLCTIRRHDSFDEPSSPIYATPQPPPPPNWANSDAFDKWLIGLDLTDNEKYWAGQAWKECAERAKTTPAPGFRDPTIEDARKLLGTWVDMKGEDSLSLLAALKQCGFVVNAIFPEDKT